MPEMALEKFCFTLRGRMKAFLRQEVRKEMKTHTQFQSFYHGQMNSILDALPMLSTLVILPLNELSSRLP